VVSSSGASCEARISGFKLRAHVTPPDGFVQAWHGEDGARPKTKAQIAEAIWSLAEESGRVLIASLDQPCRGSFAIDAKQPLPRVTTPRRARSELRALGLERFRALPEYSKLEAEFRAAGHPAPARWEEFDEHRVEAWSLGSEPSLLLVTARAGAGCADFSGRLSVLFRVSGGLQPELALLGVLDAFEPKSVFDLDGDGELEVLFGPEDLDQGRALWHRGKSGYVLDKLLSVPFLGCAC
jgi:hypothetical protein